MSIASGGMPSEASTVDGVAYRQEPNAMVNGPGRPGVRMRLGGNGDPGSGQTRRPSPPSVDRCTS